MSVTPTLNPKGHCLYVAHQHFQPPPGSVATACPVTAAVVHRGVVHRVIVCKRRQPVYDSIQHDARTKRPARKPAANLL